MAVLSRRCGECSWKRTRLRLSGWLQHADLGSLGLERSPFCVCWPKCGVELASMGDRIEQRTTRCPPYGCAWNIWTRETWHFNKIPASRRARRVRQHRNHHVSPGHRGQFTKLSIRSTQLGWIGQGSTLALDVARATATRPNVGGTLESDSLLKQSHHHRNIRFNTSPTSSAFQAARPSISSSASFQHRKLATASSTPRSIPHIHKHTPGLSAHHVGAGRPELRQRQPQEQRQRQVLRNNARRQLQQTKHPRIRWHRKHHCL